ncbi:MAG TPA: peptidylprolyl isomerase [bacterium]|nr:peptidylprolyl isomerase [bacterium]
MKVRAILMSSCLAFSLAACGSGGSAPGSGDLEKNLNQGKELATLGPVSIDEGYLEVLSRVNPNISAQLKNPAGKKRLIDSLLEQELLYKESVNRGLANKPEVQEKAALYERVIFAQAVLDDAVDKKAKDYYDANKDKEFSRVKLAHILIKTQTPPPPGADKVKIPPTATGLSEAEALKKAQEAKAKLASGTTWEAVVTEYSDDRGSKARGGEIGLVARGDRRAERFGWGEMIEKSFTMKAGEISDPILAKDGYHIVKVIEVAQVAPFDEVQNTIKFKLRSQVKNELMASLTGGKSIEYKDESLKAAASAPAPGTAAIDAATDAMQGPGPKIQVKSADEAKAPAPAAPEAKAPETKPSN